MIDDQGQVMVYDVTTVDLFIAIGELYIEKCQAEKRNLQLMARLRENSSEEQADHDDTNSHISNNT